MSLRASAVILPGLAAIAALLALSPITHDPTSCNFVDGRVVAGIPHFGDVVTNLPFAAVGVAGLAWMIRRKAPTPHKIFFLGLLLTAFGSTYYHLTPEPSTLFWDRLPMTITFMALFAAVIHERIGARWLWTLLAYGVSSVLYWRLTGDLSMYSWTQFYPMLAVPIILLLYPRRAPGPNYWVLLVVYGAAKIFELADAPVYHAIGVLSGHSLKHLLAAGGALYVAAAWRASIPAPDASARLAESMPEAKSGAAA